MGANLYHRKIRLPQKVIYVCVDGTAIPSHLAIRSKPQCYGVYVSLSLIGEPIHNVLNQAVLVRFIRFCRAVQHRRTKDLRCRNLRFIMEPLICFSPLNYSTDLHCVITHDCAHATKAYSAIAVPHFFPH